MSSTDPSVTNLEADTERPILRPQRPPPPPPTQPEPNTPPIEITIISSEPETTILSTETFNESNKDVEDDRLSFLIEFKDLFDSFDYESVRDKILNRQMTTCPFTTVLWRIFLHCLPRDSSQWDQMIDSSRENYNELADTYLLDLDKIREHDDASKHHNHPLSQEENSLWHQYYLYEELKENIYQDVVRTCQEIPFFQQKYVLDLLLRVLYIHSRHYEQSLPYRQGMHEILAVIVHLIYLESIKVNEYSESNELMKKLYDPEYLAHDSYAIYEKIMEHLQQFYDFKPNNAVTRKNIKMYGSKQILFQRSTDLQVQMNDTVMRVNSIFERLKDYEPSLYAKLEELSIEPTVYGIRWLRLLFGREVPFGSIPSLWTVIFCYNECFGFVDYFFLALLIEIGELFKKNGISEYSFYLQYLMRPNVISDVESTIQKALDLEKRTGQCLSSSFSSQSKYNRSIKSDIQEPISPMQSSSQTPLLDSLKSNSTTPFISSSQLSKPVFSNTSGDAEMTVSPGKETRQRFEDNVQTQRSCAQFMNKFIDGIRSRICALPPPNDEEALIQLNGLEQIANVLAGTLIFDDNSLQALVNYQFKDKPMRNVISDDG